MHERIKALRKALGLNQTDFGEKLGLKQTSIAGYETGSRKPMDSVICAICREFNVNEQWLRSGDGDMFLQLTRNEEITRFVGSILRDDQADFQRKLLTVLSELNPEQWELLRQMAEQLGKAE